MTPAVTVAIPVLNGARYLGEVLEAVAGQVDCGEVELLVCDSGSTDGSLEIARRFGARVHEIRKADFSHGRTRNEMVAMARAPRVAFITQDATPANTRWLASLLEGFELADDVAAVFGPHHARPDASHMIKAEMERHFVSFEPTHGALSLQRLHRTPTEMAEYRHFPGRWTFLSDVNCCVAKAVLAEIPYRDVPYAEDQLLGRELIEAGYAKVYHPDAGVLHSHDYPPLQFARRYFDEYRSLREVLGHVEQAGPVATPRTVYALTRNDVRWLGQHGASGSEIVRGGAVSARHYALRMAGAIAGSRADRLRPRVRKTLSLEGRGTFVPTSPEGSGDLVGPKGADAWTWEWVRRAQAAPPAPLAPRAPRPPGPLTVAWIVPPWKVGSGGHTTIFRLIRELEQRGHRCAIHVFDPLGLEDRRAKDLREEIREKFVAIEAQVHLGFDAWKPVDIAFATNWWTAWPLKGLEGCGEKAYLVQDFEPAFYALSSEHLWAEQTYELGFRCVSYSRWMADELKARYDIDSPFFECGTDLATYTLGEPAAREPGLVAVYARRETDRRAVDLALAGLATLVERRPGVRVALFGSNVKPSSPVIATDYGVCAPEELAALYRRASAGVVFSLTTHSLVAQEMMASGLPLVELNGANVTSAFGASGELAELVDPDPAAIADGLERILDHPDEAAAMAGRARAFVETLTWQDAGDRVEAALHGFLAERR